MADFLRSKCHLELLHWSNNTQIALHSLGVVIVNVIPNHSNKLLLGVKSLAIIFGSSRKVRETNREEPNEHKEETVISVAISKALGNFNLVIESLKFTC